MRSPEDPRLARSTVSGDRPEVGPAAIKVTRSLSDVEASVTPNLPATPPYMPREEAVCASDIHNARIALGKLWNLGRPLEAFELSRLLKLNTLYGEQLIRDVEKGLHDFPGPIAVGIELMLKGVKPSHYDEIFPPGGSAQTLRLRMG